MSAMQNVVTLVRDVHDSSIVSVLLGLSLISSLCESGESLGRVTNDFQSQSSVQCVQPRLLHTNIYYQTDTTMLVLLVTRRSGSLVACRYRLFVGL